VCQITAAPEGARIGGAGELLDHAVKMREFDSSAELAGRMQAGTVSDADFRQFGASLAGIHGRESARARPPGAADPVAAVLGNAQECIAAARSAGADDAAAVAAVRDALSVEARLRSVTLRERERGGRVRDCHGDLHVGNIAAIRGRLVAFDCLEFDERLRVIDVAQEIAFLAMDLRERGHAAAAAAFLNGYLDASGDFGACRLLPLFEAHCALVRAKVEALVASGTARGSAEQRAALVRHRQYVGYAGARLIAARPTCTLVAGPSGSGKSWLAERVALRTGAVHVRSDLERKRLAGLDPVAHAPAAVGEGLYTGALTNEVYRQLADDAASILEGGLAVIVDATFLSQAQRAAFVAALESRCARVRIIWCTAPAAELRRRIEQRARGDADPSDADVRVLEAQLAVLEPPAGAERGRVLDLDTRSALVVEQAAAWINGAAG
jgi:hypothetical protein